MPQRDAPQQQNTSFRHMLPQNVAAEEAIISAVLVDNSTLLDVVEILSPEDFYKSAHQKIFSAITDLFAKSEPVDLVTLTNSLKERGHLEEIGGASYLADLVDKVPLAVNAQHYARIIYDKASLRRLIEKSNTILQKCFDDRGDIDSIIDFAESAVFEVSEGKYRQGFSPIGKLIEQNIDMLEERQGNKALVTGVSTGFSKLDHLTAGLQSSDLIILAARPSMGKTALALNIARNAAVDAQTPVAIFSLEMSK